MNNGSTKREFKKVTKRYERTHAKLEKIRSESRQVRKELIEGILCDAKDVLSRTDIAHIQKTLKKFLAVQRRLGKAWFDHSNDFGALLWAADGCPTDGEM